MVAIHSGGEWMTYLPRHSINQWEYYDDALYQALTMSCTGFGDGDLTKPLLCKTNGYQILWQLGYVADHPCLVKCHIDITMPKQKSNESLLQYCQNWTYYLHMIYLRSVFLSDRYFVECFPRNLHDKN